MRLRRLPEPGLTRLIGTARAAERRLDGGTVGSLLTPCGIEIGAMAGEVHHGLMADHLREIADTSDEGAAALPILGRVASERFDEPTL